MPSQQLGRSADRDVAPPVLLGIFAHAEASECDCLVPECEDAAVGFATFLWRGIVAIPVCHDHGLRVMTTDRSFVPSLQKVLAP